MGKKTILSTSAMILLLLQANLFAAGWTSTPTTIDGLRITDGDLMFGDVANGKTILLCGGNGIRVDTSTPLFKELVSMLLSAQVTGAKVKFYQTGACVSGSNTMINGVQLFR